MTPSPLDPDASTSTGRPYAWWCNDATGGDGVGTKTYLTTLHVWPIVSVTVNAMALIVGMEWSATSITRYSVPPLSMMGESAHPTYVPFVAVTLRMSPNAKQSVKSAKSAAHTFWSGN